MQKVVKHQSLVMMKLQMMIGEMKITMDTSIEEEGSYN